MKPKDAFSLTGWNFIDYHKEDNENLHIENKPQQSQKEILDQHNEKGAIKIDWMLINMLQNYHSSYNLQTKFLSLML